MCVWDESTWVVHSTFILCGAALCFLKETEGTNDPFAVAQTCTICACPVTLSSSSNIQTSVQFKLAGHGPVTYFPHNMLCNIRGEAVCHQLTNLHHRIVWAERRGNPDTALLKQRVPMIMVMSQKKKCPQGLFLRLLLKVKHNVVNW